MNPSIRRILVTGPVRSGKSEWAEFLATQSGKSVIYIATASYDTRGAACDPNPDQEWLARIAQHQLRRPDTWQTREVPVDLASVLRQGRAGECLLIDSLGTWLANILEQSPADWEQSWADLVAACQSCEANWIFVAEEVVWELVPAYPLGRTFRDRLGVLVRQLVAIANVTYLVTAGHVLNLTELGTPLPLAMRPPEDTRTNLNFGLY